MGQFLLIFETGGSIWF